MSPCHGVWSGFNSRMGRQLRKEDVMDRWKLEAKIEKIIDRNCIEHPWEGTEVYKQNIKDEIMELIEDVIDETNFGLGTE